MHANNQSQLLPQTKLTDSHPK